jgi:glycosyltransferase involved in cell wall biosynthesis
LTHRENASTHSNPDSRSAHIEASRKVFRSKWGRSLEEKRYTRDLGWQSTLSSPAGYAIGSRELVSALDDGGVFVSYRSVCGPGAATPRNEPPETQSERIRTTRARKLRPEQVQVLFGQGDLFQSNFGRYKIGFTMLETNRIPAEWARQANQMDEVWTPSTFNLKTFQESGVTRPLYTIPLGVDPNYFNQRIRGYPIGSMYTFLSIFEWEERKAPELLLRAFNREFRASEPAILLVKATNANPRVDVEREIANLGLDPQGGAIHFSLDQIVPAYELGVLYRSANCFVLPTRGEAWGMPIMEAMACGLPVIATDWSAQRDFMNERNAFPLPVERLVPADIKRSDYQGLLWAEPSYAHLRRLLRYVYENQEEGRAKGERAASEIRNSWTWWHSAQAIIARLDKIQPRAFSGESWPRNLRDSGSFVR